MASATSAFRASAGEAPKQVNSSIPTLKLNDGNEIPVLGFGFGTARYKADPNGPLDEETIKAGVLALKTGFRHLDAAEVYGNEEEVGLVIKKSGVARDEIYLTTKYAGTKAPLDVTESFALSLKKLDVEYVDQYLIHEPFSSDSPKSLQEKWAALEAILASGKARSIGVSNFLQTDLEAILETAKVVPAINQIEYHPYLQHGDLLDFHKKHGIATSVYGPLTAVTKASPGPLDGTYEVLAKKYGVTPGEVALRWVIDQGAVVLTTSTNEERLKGFLNIEQFKLTPEEVEDIKEKGKGKNFRGFWGHKIAKDDFR